MSKNKEDKLTFTDWDIDSNLLQMIKIHTMIREDSVKEAETSAKVIVKEAEKRGIKIQYDVSYGGHPHELKYSEFMAGLGGAYSTPCCGKMIDFMWKNQYDTSNNVDFAEYIDDRHDKYMMASYDIKPMKALVVLPGSNIITKTVDKVMLNGAVDLGAYIKPHPMTNDDIIDRLNQEYPGRVLPRLYSGFKAMEKSKLIFGTGASELALYAMLLDKYVIDISNNIPGGGYFDVFKRVMRMDGNQKENLNYILNSPYVGIFLPGHHKKPSEWFDLYQKELRKFQNGRK